MTVWIESGALNRLGGLLRAQGSRHVFVVAGNQSFIRSGAEETLHQTLEGLPVTLCRGIEENPSLTQLEPTIARFRESGADTVVGVGGGSAMDIAKLVAILADKPGPLLPYIQGDALSPRSIPLILVPTTAGSGSQATHYSVLYVEQTKHSVAHASMLPDHALVDSDLLRSLPRSVMASAGLDALNQGIESYWSVQSTDESRDFAKQAIELAWRHLPDAVTAPDDASRLAMARSAHLAGEAINITKTTAPHAISYPITSYFGVPHGHAVGLVLADILRFNADVTADDCLDSRGAGHVRSTLSDIAALLGASDIEQAAQRYEQLLDRIELTRRFADLGIRSAADIETIVSNGFNPERVNNNPRRLTETALRERLNKLI